MELSQSASRALGVLAAALGLFVAAPFFITLLGPLLAAACGIG